MKVELISCGPAVNESERKAVAQLKTRLIAEPGDDEWLLLTNLAFSTTHRRQSDEIDIVAIGPPGVRVIEVKHWNAAWVNRNPELVEREAERVTNKARKVGTTLRQKVSELDRVDGVFLVTQDAAKVRPLEGREVRGVRFHTLRTSQGALGLAAPASLTPSQVKMLGKALYPKASVSIDGALRRLAGYVNLELQTPADERFHRMYQGTHSTRRDPVLLHLYDLSATDQPNPEERARREFGALHRLQLRPWAPRIVDSFQEAPGYAGEMWFFTVADPAAPSVEHRAADDGWDAKARLAFARQAVEALMELHEAGEGEEPMLHRNLTPGTILVRHDNTPILTGFQYARIPADITVAVSGGIEDKWDDAVAPEVRQRGLGAADRRSDVYSLCASLAVLFAERNEEASRVLAEGTADDPAERVALEKLRDSLAALLGEPPEVVAPPARFWTEDQVVNFRGRNYRLGSRLGSGGVGTTFKVVELDGATGGDLGAYVAKVVWDKATGDQILPAYNLARSHLAGSAALSTIFETAAEGRDNDFVALMQWIEGEPLSELAGVLPILAEDFHEESAEALALRWLRTVCDALDVLHRNGLVHGDVSPRNLIVANDAIVLTDYDCVAKVGEPVAVPGTVLYSADMPRLAAPADDFFALAASFFQVLFEKEPFMYDGNRAKERGLNWESIEREEYPMVAAFMDQATNPEAAQRFASAAEARAALSPDSVNPDEPEEDTPAPEPPARRKNEVPHLQDLLRSYPGSRWGNSETRGLDTDFAAQTYVKTPLEDALHDDIWSRKVRLVILCGNAGDGKTALLQHLAGRLGFGVHNSSERILENQIDGGLIVRMNLDGSASWEGRSADALLDEFLAPFQQGAPEEDLVHLLAINDGRLLEWIERVESEAETPLTQALYSLLNGEEPAPESHVRFISLNQRSLVGRVVPSESRIETGFLEDLLDSLYGKEKAPQIWAPCETCSAQDRCEVRRAMRRFGPKGLPGVAPEDERTRARQRLFEMLQAVHLRGETHITVRELRAALVYILFGVHFCSDYHDGADDLLPYWYRAFAPESPGRQGEVLQELIRFDPALEAHPQLDRQLLREHAGGLESARRRAYFEWTEGDLDERAGDPHALGLAQARHYQEFGNIPIAEGGLYDLCRRLCKGIAHLESLPPQALDRPDVVPLRITPRTPTETAFWVEKPVTRFRLEADLPAEAEGLDRLHRQAFLIYRYQDGREERLRLGADLFHLLLELSDGYQLGDVSTDDTFAHLSIFVQRLVREDDRSVLAWNPTQDEAIYEVSAEIVEGAEVGVQQQMIIRRLEETKNG